ncbi:uncharacterized protein, partial [Littorina saxatilis]|uniref:uncharacterized protein n=1 Tax=Littorina saxatilis TaxID=31220 RepID=UPI0038B482A2
RFEFPKLNDSSRLTSDGRHTIVVEFRAHPSCNASDNLAYSVGKEVNGHAKHHCLIMPAKVKCMEKCTCPAEGSDLYRLELAAEPLNNGTWTWSAIPSSVMEKHSMWILIDGIDASTEETTTKTITVKTQTASETLLASSSSYDPAKIKTTEGGSDNLYKAAFFLSLPGIILLTFNGVIIVSVISLVIVVMKRRGRRLRLSLQGGISLQELQQDRQQLVPPLAHQQRQLPEIPGQQNVPPQCPTPLVLTRSGPGGRRYRSQESNFYEIIDDDERSDEGVRASASAPDLRASNQCADYLHPIPSRQEAAEARAKNPHYENRPLYENYFHPWNVKTEPHQ